MTTDLDARVVANAILRECWKQGIEISNIKLQKLLFLCHSIFLIRTGGKNLINEEFEAWKYGPVHRGAYEAFAEYGSKSIDEIAEKLDPIKQEYSPLPTLEGKQATRVVEDVVENFARKSASELVELTHRKDGPWDYVMEDAKKNVNIGLRISNEIIKERIKYLWFGKDVELDVKEPEDDKIQIA